MDSNTLVTVTTTLALLVVVLTLLSAGRNKPDPRLAEINRKLQLILDHLEITDPGPQASAAVLGELQQGRTIQAIKLYREETGAGLAEAKDAVEQIARRQGL